MTVEVPVGLAVRVVVKVEVAEVVAVVVGERDIESESGSESE